MRNRLTRIAVATCTLFGGGYLFASGNLSCGSFATEAAVSAVDMCFIFDCTNGAFGGLIDPCATTQGTDTSGAGGGGGGQGGVFTGPGTGTFFADCPTDGTVN